MLSNIFGFIVGMIIIAIAIYFIRLIVIPIVNFALRLFINFIKYSLYALLVFFLYKALTYKIPTEEQRKIANERSIRDLDSVWASHGLPISQSEPERQVISIVFSVHPKDEPEFEATLTSDDVDVDVLPDGGYPIFNFDKELVCFSREQINTESIRCWNRKTKQNVTVDLVEYYSKRKELKFVRKPDIQIDSKTVAVYEFYFASDPTNVIRITSNDVDMDNVDINDIPIFPVKKTYICFSKEKLGNGQIKCFNHRLWLIETLETKRKSQSPD